MKTMYKKFTKERQPAVTAQVAADGPSKVTTTLKWASFLWASSRGQSR